MVRYVLMNKNTPVQDFCTQRDEFGDIEIVAGKQYAPKMPLGFVNLQAFLEGRMAPRHRKHISEILERFQCEDLEGLFRVSHAASLNDTYWVRSEAESLAWESVSLYTNEFNDWIARAAFDGNFSGTSPSFPSPEFGTDGRFAKCWVRDADGIWLHKAGSDTFGTEPISEYLASQLAMAFCKDAVHYDLTFYHGKLASTCALFTSEEIGLVKGQALLHGMVQKSPTIRAKDILTLYERYGFGDFCRRMFIFDAICLNIDRHPGNFGMLFDTDTLQICAPAPLYDNNRSLLFDLDDDQLERADWFIQKAKPRIGKSFLSVGKDMLTDSLRKDLKKLQGFRFENHSGVFISDDRLQILSRIVYRQIAALFEK